MAIIQVATNKDFQDWALQRQMRMEVVLGEFLPSPELAPQRLHQAMRYVALDGGKRVRPLLAFAAGELSAAPLQRVETVAAAVELIHVYSLVHDDLPCMDDDKLRRGKPTCHVQFDEATALLVAIACKAWLSNSWPSGRLRTVHPCNSKWSGCWLWLPVRVAWQVGRRSISIRLERH